MENEKNNNQLQIELKEEVAQGTYANLAIITHSSSEFIVDFVRVMPGLPKAGVQSCFLQTSIRIAGLQKIRSHYQSALQGHRIYAQHTRYRRYHRDSYFQDHTPYGFLDCHNSTPPFHAIKKNDCHRVEITVPCSLRSTDTP